MKLLFVLLTLFSINSYAVNISGGVPAQMGILVTSSTNLGPSYAQSNSTALSALKGVSRISVYNGSSTAIAFSVNTDSCSTSSKDAFVVPGTTGLVVENVAVHKAICLRSLSGSSISSGSIYTSAW